MNTYSRLPQGCLGVLEPPGCGTGKLQTLDFSRSNTWTSPSCWEHWEQQEVFCLLDCRKGPQQPGCIASPTGPGWLHPYPPTIIRALSWEDFVTLLLFQQNRLIGLFLWLKVSDFLQSQADITMGNVMHIVVHIAGVGVAVVHVIMIYFQISFQTTSPGTWEILITIW